MYPNTMGGGNVLPVPPDMLGFVPVIADEIFQQVRANDGKNPLRVSQARMLMNNGGANSSVDELICFVADIIKLNAHKGIHLDNAGNMGWPQSLRNTVNFILMVHCAMMVKGDRSFLNGMSAEIARQIEGALNTFQNTMQEVKAMKNPNVMRTTGGYGNDYAYSNNAYSNTSYSGNNRGTPAAAAGLSTSAGGVFTTDSGTNPVAREPYVSTGNAAEDRAARAQRQIDAARARVSGGGNSYAPNHPALSGAVAAPPPPPVEPEIVFNDQDWRPCADEPYPPAVNALTETRAIVAIKEKEGFYLQFNVNKQGVAEMDFNRDSHRLTSAAERATSFIPVGQASRGSAFENSMRQLAKAQEAVNKLPDDAPAEARADAIKKFTAMMAVETTDCTSLQQFVFTARYIAKSRLGDVAEEVAYRINGRVSKEFPVLTNLDDFVEVIGQSTSMVDVLDMMGARLYDDQVTKDEAAFMAKLDTYITQRVNHFVRFNLGILTLRIDSVMSDYNDLLSELDRCHGPLYSDAMQRWERAIIETYLQFSRSEEYEMRGDGETEEATAAFTPIVYQTKVATSVTTVGLYAKELNIDTIINQPCYIRPEISPALATYVRETLESSKTTLMNHFFITSDDVMFELTLGAATAQAGPGYYLITRMN